MYIFDIMNGMKVREVTFYKNYFADFFLKQKPKVQDKIIWTIKLIETQKNIPTIYLKHIKGTNGLFEIRIQFGNDIFRIFCFFDDGKIIVLTNGFQKKSQSTPKSEIIKALKIKNEYEQEK